MFENERSKRDTRLEETQVMRQAQGGNNNGRLHVRAHAYDAIQPRIQTP